MANEQNLVNLKDRTKTEQRAIARMGGVASGEARRQKRTLKEIGDMIGNLKMTNEQNKETLRKAGISDEDMINDVGMMFRLGQKAQSGDPRAIELLSKLRGELNSDNAIFAGANIESITINFGKGK